MPIRWSTTASRAALLVELARTATESSRSGISIIIAATPPIPPPWLRTTPPAPRETTQTRALHAYLRWRNANARHQDVLAAERRERARVRSEKGIRWGGRARMAA
ncbi:hypothetical protein [Streptomyces sp. LN549]|uniref:hypothetical protein n=1 Tax=Streptomyces sp. LN549 TaxID=3112979 RepID=UPI003719A319